ncbi:hypothetical protein AKO1_004995 [Acrasis kona]|uniref:DUF218 domain-containing protein n=1 Tax=Acrasis kona TaxID=1008807 RepID=A0AAW2Z4H2_9EUKA
MNFLQSRGEILPMYVTGKKSQKRLYYLVGLVVIFLIFIVFFTHNRGREITIIQSSSEPLSLDTLIMVPCHAIYTGGDVTSAQSWILEEYQKDSNQHLIFISHIEEGIKLLSRNKDALLVFSGGMTRANSNGKSEAGGYWDVAREKIEDESVRSRIVTEDFARDSFENLLFSLARFYEMTLKWPSKIVTVGFEFKRKRFEDLHRKALTWPVDKFQYVGIDPVSAVDVEKARKGELQNSFLPFSDDLYGCRSSLLKKRISRNPYRRTAPYKLSVPSMSALFDWCPDGDEIYGGKLPWI